MRPHEHEKRRLQMFIAFAWMSNVCPISGIAIWHFTPREAWDEYVALLCVLLLFALCYAGLVTSVVSLRGVTSWRAAMFIVPGAILGLVLNCFAPLTPCMGPFVPPGFR